jgi:hypothetical protein
MILLLWATFHRALGPAREKWSGPLEPFGSKKVAEIGDSYPFPCRRSTGEIQLAGGWRPVHEKSGS